MTTEFEMELAHLVYTDIKNRSGQYPRYTKYEKDGLVYITNTYYIVRFSKASHEMFLELFDDELNLKPLPERAVKEVINDLWENIPEREVKKSPLEWNGSKIYQVGEEDMKEIKGMWENAK